MSRRRLPARWIAFALRVLGAVLVIGFLGGAAVATGAALDRSTAVETVETVETVEPVEDLEPDPALVAATIAPPLVRDLHDCRSTIDRRLTMARASAPAVPPPRA